MKNLLALFVVAPTLCPLALGAQADSAKVSVSAQGHDVRLVLTDMFQQVKKSCVIQQNLHENLFLTLSSEPFDQALVIVCRQTNLSFEVKDGVYYIHHAVAIPTVVVPKIVAPVRVEKPQVVAERLSPNVLNRRVTTRLSKTPLSEVLLALSEQTRTKIELDPKVPAYKLDAFLINTSLKYALDRLTKAAGLTYAFTDHDSILVSPEESKVALAQ